MSEYVLNVSEEDIGERIDKFISDKCDGISRSMAADLCEKGNVISDEKTLKKNYKLKGGETIRVNVPKAEPAEILPQDIPLDIVYEDDDLIVVNKRQGMVVHPAAGNPSRTLVNALMFHCQNNLSAINGVVRPGIVHRIDKATSGLIVAAKTNKAHVCLAEQLKEHKPLRKYIALVNGNIKEDEGTIDKPLARNPSDRKKMAVVVGGKNAVTHYKVIKRYGEYTLVECVLETGRTHQIRVHMASIGHSIVGDKAYGIKKERFNLNGQLLHAKTIGFKHPSTGEDMLFTSELPVHFKKVLDTLDKKL